MKILLCLKFHSSDILVERFGKGRHGEKPRFQEQRKDRKMAAVQSMRQQQAPSKVRANNNDTNKILLII